MNYTDWSSKLEQVLKRTDKDTLYDYLCDYAKSHEELAMALIGEFWQTEKDDYKSMVQKCLMHPTTEEVMMTTTTNQNMSTPSRLSRLQDAYEYKIKHGWTPLTPEEEVEFHKMIAEFTNL